MARTASEDVRKRIVDAAHERLWRYGFKKTTIDEIAADAGVGKGTVYLHFESKEDICLAIIAEYKQESLEQGQSIARDPTKDVARRLTEMLALPIMTANRRCQATPAAQEMLVALRPHFQTRMRPYIEREYALIAEVLEEGNQSGIFDVPDTMQAARTLKCMTHGLLPPYPYVGTLAEIETEIGLVVGLAVHGLRRCP